MKKVRMRLLSLGVMLSLFFVVLAQPVAASTEILLPKTGQTTSYAIGDDGDLQTGVAWPAPRFNLVGDGIVADNLTGLIWAQNASTPTSTTCVGGPKNWQGALDYVACLNSTNYLGHNDWLLPNINELKSLLDAEHNYPSLPSDALFTGVLLNNYWSSTTFANDSRFALIVDMGNGFVGEVSLGGEKTRYYQVLPVREGAWSFATLSLPATGQISSYAAGDDGARQRGVPSPNIRFTDHGDGTATDNLTGLVWLQNANCFGLKTWTDALNSANTLKDGSCNLRDGSVPGNWRIPNRYELESLVDRSRTVPPLPANHPFSSVQNYYYWSSTTFASGTGSALDLSANGQLFLFDKATPDDYLWPVRSLLFYPLTVTSNGNGSVTPDIGTLSWTDNTGVGTYDERSVVTLTATGDPGYGLAGWSGACSGSGPCVVTMKGAKEVTATFLPSAPSPSWVLIQPSSNTGNYSFGWEDTHVAGALYKVEVSSDGGQSYVALGTTSNSWYEVSGQVNGTYRYRVSTSKAGYADSTPTETGAIMVLIQASLTPVNQIILPPSSDTGTYKVSWTSTLPNKTSYRLEESNNGGVSYRVITNTPNKAVSFIGKGPGTYQYRLSAPGSVTGLNMVSAPIVVTRTCANLGAITLPEKNSTGSYQLSWVRSATAGVSYMVRESFNKGPFLPVKTTTGNAISFTGKTSGSYLYIIQAIKPGYLPSAASFSMVLRVRVIPPDPVK